MGPRLSRGRRLGWMFLLRFHFTQGFLLLWRFYWNFFEYKCRRKCRRRSLFSSRRFRFHHFPNRMFLDLVFTVRNWFLFAFYDTLIIIPMAITRFSFDIFIK